MLISTTIHPQVLLYFLPTWDSFIVFLLLLGTISYNVTYNGDAENVLVNVALLDKTGHQVAEGTNNSTFDSGATGGIILPRANLWWPYLMDENPGYLYTLQVHPKKIFILFFQKNPNRLGIVSGELNVRNRRHVGPLPSSGRHKEPLLEQH